MTGCDPEEFRDEPRDLAEDMIRFFEGVDDIEAVHEKMKNDEFEEAFEMMRLTEEQAGSIVRSWYARLMTIMTRSNRKYIHDHPTLRDPPELPLEEAPAIHSYRDPPRCHFRVKASWCTFVLYPRGSTT